MDKTPVFKVECLIQTWKKVIEDLYDFETNDLNRDDLTIDPTQNSVYLVKKNNDEICQINNLQDKLLLNPKTKIFLEIGFNKDTNRYELRSPNISKNLFIINEDKIEYPWIRLLSLDFKPIEIGDIIKIGRIRIKLSKIINPTDPFMVTASSNEENSSFENSQTMKNWTKESMNRNKESCRICFLTESDLDNPLISPCKCTGSIKFMHLKCLQKAIETKCTIVENNHYKLIQWKNLNCEICLQEYPIMYKYNDRTYHIINNANFQFEKYAVFDYFLFEDDKSRAFRRGVLYINLDSNDLGEKENLITIGRTQSNKVKLKNISVSRFHCTLKFKNNKLYVKDENSKFGTMLFMKRNIELIPSFNVSSFDNSLYYTDNSNLISGKFCMDFSLKKKSNFFVDLFTFGCCRANNTIESDIIFENKKDKKTEKIQGCLNEIKSDSDKIVKRNNVYSDIIMNIDKIYICGDVSDDNL